jgi:hypothetical protein
MQTVSIQEPLVLSSGQVMSFVLLEPVQVRIERGCVWLTISGMAEDFWISEGDTLDLPAHRQIVIEAHKAASLFKLCATPELFSIADGMFDNTTEGRNRQRSCSC